MKTELEEIKKSLKRMDSLNIKSKLNVRQGRRIVYINNKIVYKSNH